MIRELETLAKDYLIYKNSVSDSPVENYSPSNRSINELVLGYIRGINVNYTESGALHYVKRWSMVAGTIDTAFIQYVSQYGNTGTDITFPAFFASFLQNASNYNTSLYGNISSTCLNKNYILIDPLSSGQGIDLIHMIASIDGIYSTTLAGGTEILNETLPLGWVICRVLQMNLMMLTISAICLIIIIHLGILISTNSSTHKALTT